MLKRKRFSNMPVLSEELIMEIFTWLPASSVVRFRYLNKSCNSWIQSKYFIKLHLRRTIENINRTRRWRLLMSTFRKPAWSFKVEGLDKPRPRIGDLVDNNVAQVIGDFDFSKDIFTWVIGSSNGLLCIYLQRISSFLVWNPCTGVRHYIDWLETFFFGDPMTDYDSEDGYEPLFEWNIMGFGSSVDGYKLLRFGKRYGSHEDHCGHRITVEISVYTLGTAAPRKTTQMVPRMALRDPGLYLNGALHWVDKQSDMPTGVRRGIVMFSLEKEKFEQVIPLPGHADNDDEKLKSSNLRIVCGKLAVFWFAKYEIGTFDFEMWIMEEYGVKGSWTRKITISDKYNVIFRKFMVPLSLLKNGNVLLNLDNQRMVVYDPKEKTYSTIKSLIPLRRQMEYEYPDGTEYIETLVSPLCNEDAATASHF